MQGGSKQFHQRAIGGDDYLVLKYMLNELFFAKQCIAEVFQNIEVVVLLVDNTTAITIIQLYSLISLFYEY